MTAARTTGKVKFFADDRGFGFILADSGSEYFVHRTDLEAPGHCNDEGRLTLEPDERVSFEVVDNPRKSGGKKAARVQVV
jgi:CspA family cold shock protein